MSDSAASMSSGRTYRFDPLDRGVVFGLGVSQLAIMGMSGALWLVAMITRVPFLLPTLVLAVAWALALVPVNGQPLAMWLPIVGRWLAGGRQRRWFRPLQLLTAEELDRLAPALPPFLRGLELIALDAVGWGAIRDRGEGTMTAVVPISGSGFLTLPRAEQEWLLAGWGAVFTSFADDGSSVVRLCWSDIARPANLEDHEEWAARQAGDGGGTRLSEYLAFTRSTNPTRHDLVVSITVRAGRARSRANGAGMAEVLLSAVEVLRDALKEARLATGDPLSAHELAFMLRAGLDPTTVDPRGGRRSGPLASRLGLVPPSEAGPMMTMTQANRIVIDGSHHRIYWVSGWPEMAQQPDWFEPLLSTEVGSVQRTVTVVIEPIAEDKAIRKEGAADVRLTSDNNARAEAQRRVGARDVRKQAAARTREEEIVSGFAGVSYAGLVTITAPLGDDLVRACRSYERRFYRRRVSLRLLWGRQDLAMASGLPLGLGLSRSSPL